MNKYRKDQFHYIVAKPADRPASVPGGVQGDLHRDLALMSDAWAAYRSRGLVEDAIDHGLFENFQAEFYRYLATTSTFSRLTDHGQGQAAANLLGDGPGDHQWDRLKLLIATWNNHKVATARSAAAASRASYDAGVKLIIGLLAAAVAIAVIVAVVLARRTTRAVRDVGAAAKAISHGDIHQRVVVRSSDELGQMAADFETMIAYLSGTVSVAEAIAGGNLDVEVRPRSDRDALGTALAGMTNSLRRVNEENQRLLAQTRHEAETDALTGLPNRRALTRDLERQLADGRPLMLALFDLDGFKEYNDTFGHPTGDALLARMGIRLREALGHDGTGYRMGGDEFCVLAAVDERDGAAVAARAARALTEKGEAFAIGCSYGIANLPQDADTATTALRVADDRMYANKTSRVSASRQSTDVLLTALTEHSPELIEHLSEVARLATNTAERLGLGEAEIRRVRLAAELHDVGKVAIPETILNKPGPLDDGEWEFMRRHTVIGERIVSAAPCLAAAAELVRWSHERHDGSGYPDGLGGDEIPVGACIIAVCDAFEAMTATRPYSSAMSPDEAIAELRRCAGSQFHPEAVAVFCELMEHGEAPELKAA